MLIINSTKPELQNIETDLPISNKIPSLFDFDSAQLYFIYISNFLQVHSVKLKGPPSNSCKSNGSSLVSNVDMSTGSPLNQLVQHKNSCRAQSRL